MPGRRFERKIHKIPLSTRRSSTQDITLGFVGDIGWMRVHSVSVRVLCTVKTLFGGLDPVHSMSRPHNP